MDYRGSMALPQPPLGHLQIPSAGSLSNASPTSYQTSSGIPVSLVRNTPNDGMPSAAKRQRLDSSASSGGYGGDNPYALHGDVQSPASYGLSTGLFPPSGQRQGSSGNPASPTAHQFFPQSLNAFPRTGSGGGNSRNSFSGGGSGSYQGNQPPIYNPSNPFASLIGSANNAPPGSSSAASPHGHGHGHAHHPGSSFEPLDWPVHNPSSSGQQQSASQQQTSADRGGPSSASPHPQSQSQQGFPPRPGQTSSGGPGAGPQDTSWLDFLSNSAPPPAGAGADTSRPGSVTSGGASRRIEDSYERGMSGISASQVQRSRSDSSVKEEGGVSARAASVNSASDASRPSANGSVLTGGGDSKEGLDIQSDVSHQRQNLGNLTLLINLFLCVSRRIDFDSGPKENLRYSSFDRSVFILPRVLFTPFFFWSACSLYTRVCSLLLTHDLISAPNMAEFLNLSLRPFSIVNLIAKNSTTIDSSSFRRHEARRTKAKFYLSCKIWSSVYFCVSVLASWLDYFRLLDSSDFSIDTNL